MVLRSRDYFYLLLCSFFFTFNVYILKFCAILILYLTKVTRLLENWNLHLILQNLQIRFCYVILRRFAPRKATYPVNEPRASKTDEPSVIFPPYQGEKWPRLSWHLPACGFQISERRRDVVAGRYEKNTRYWKTSKKREIVEIRIE